MQPIPQESSWYYQGRSSPQFGCWFPESTGPGGFLLFPLISGAIVGYNISSNASVRAALWLLLTALSAFLIYQPLESLLGFSLINARSRQQQRVAMLSVMALAVMATIGVLELFHLHRELVLGFGLAALGYFCVRLLLGSSRPMRVPRQLIGPLGLSSAAAAAYYAASGRIDRTAILLWLASWFFAVGQIEYVHLRISTAQVNSWRQRVRLSVPLCFLHVLIIGASLTAAFTGFAPLLLALAFVPSIIRVGVWIARPWQPLRVHILGFTELVQGLLFNILLVGAFLIRD